MKQAYYHIRLGKDKLALIELINTLIDGYLAQGYTLSVRQLYYQLVARDIVPNTENSYKRVASIINDGRLAGLIDWDAIEDRNRDIELRTRWTSGGQIIQAAASSYHMDMWKGQEYRVFAVVEKAALAGVMAGVCRKWDIPLLAARGYPSVSIVRELTREHLMPAARAGQRCVMLHLGDHDPSGIDMSRDLQERVTMFMESYRRDWQLDRLALNMDQVEHYSPPPNPAKTTDSRYADYMDRFGDESWELDALEPSVLVRLIESRVSELVDPDIWEDRRQYVEDIRGKLQAAADNFED